MKTGPQVSEAAGLLKLSCCCSVAMSCLTLGDSIDCSTPGFPVLHHLLEFAQTQVHGVDDADNLIFCHPLFLPSIFRPHLMHVHPASAAAAPAAMNSLLVCIIVNSY